MPNRDGTGPHGKGAQTGYGRGQAQGRGYAGGCGRPMGNRLAQMTLDEREIFLKKQLEAVSAEREKIS